MYRTILHATDLTENHFNLCEKAAKFAREIKATIYFLHVIEIPVSYVLAQNLGFAELSVPIRDGAEAVMTTLSDALNLPRENFFIETGSASQHILEIIPKINCELILLGSHHTSALPTFSGSTAHAVLHHAPCDVLTLRG